MAKPRAIGADAVQLFGFEGVYGTPPDGSGGGVYYRLIMSSDDVSAEQPLEDDDNWNRLVPEDGDPSLGALTVGGDVVLPMDVRASGIAMLAALGEATTSVVTADVLWEHEWTSGQDLPSVSKQMGHPKLAAPKWRTQFGGKAGGFSFPMARNGRAKLTLPMIFQGEVKDVAGARDADPITFAYTPFDNCEGAITIGGVALGNATDGQVTFSNGLEPAETIRADQKIDGLDETIRKGNGSLTVRVSNDATIDDLVDANTSAALKFKFTLPSHATWYLEVQFPRVFFGRSKKPVNGPGGVSQSLNWRAAYDEGAGHLMKVVLRNDVESYEFA